MTLPINTTTITIRRPDERADPLDAPVVRHMQSGVRAVIGSPSGADQMAGGDRSVISARLNADPCDLRTIDEVQDDVTGDRYQVAWTRHRVGFGLDHVEAGLSEVIGAPGG